MRGKHLGEFEELLLLIVRLADSQSHSVGIQDALRNHANRQVSLGAIYAALDRLERKGFVRSWIGEPEARPGGRARRFYEVTPEGREELGAVRDVRELLWSLGPNTRR